MGGMCDRSPLARTLCVCPSVAATLTGSLCSCRSHGGVGRNPDGSYFYTHGGFLGHIVPGSFFIVSPCLPRPCCSPLRHRLHELRHQILQIWGTWWLVATYWSYVRTAAVRRPFLSRTWYRLWFGPAWLRRFPLEPVIKMILPFFGILGELWLGHESWRTLVGPDRKFIVDNINEWQHSTMYSAFIASGAIDLVGHVAQLPLGTERLFLGLAFLCQGLLLVFHLKGPPIEVS